MALPRGGVGRPHGHLAPRRGHQDPARHGRRPDVRGGRPALRTRGEGRTARGLQTHGQQDRERQGRLRPAAAAGRPKATRQVTQEHVCGHRAALQAVAARLRDTSIDPRARFAMAQLPETGPAPRPPAPGAGDQVGQDTIRVDRRRALFGSWYEFFPRSEGAIVERDRRQVREVPRPLRSGCPPIAEDGLRRRLPAADPPDRAQRSARAATTP